MRLLQILRLLAFAGCCSILPAQQAATASQPDAAPRGSYGPYRANNDLLFYRLTVRVDPQQKFLSGSNTIRFRMLQDGNRIQLDLHAALTVAKVLFRGNPAQFRREGDTFFVDLPTMLHRGDTYEVTVFLQWFPRRGGPFRRRPVPTG